MSQLDNLVHRCQQGELAAFSELFQMQETAVYRLALTILQNEQDAEDAVQDVFLRVFEQIKGYQRQSAFKTWLTAITVNSCRDKLRLRKVRRAFTLDWLRGHASHHNVPAEADQRQQSQQLWHLINTTLDDKHRLPLILHYHERLSCAEVADMLGIRISTVYSRLNTARQRLRDQLQAESEPSFKRG
jgi:RNA polymerase sigma-70 factor (ECF subfamily)